MFNLGRTPLRHPVPGFAPIDDIRALYASELISFRRQYHLVEALSAQHEAAKRSQANQRASDVPLLSPAIIAPPAVEAAPDVDDNNKKKQSDDDDDNDNAAQLDAESWSARVLRSAAHAAHRWSARTALDAGTQLPLVASIDDEIEAGLTDSDAPATSAGRALVSVGENTVLVLKRRDDEPFVLRKLLVEAQQRHGMTSSPVRRGFVFLFDEALDDRTIDRQVAMYDSLPEPAFAALEARNGPTVAEMFAGADVPPVAWFRIADTLSTTITLPDAALRPARRVAVKVYGDRHGRVDVSLFRGSGTPGPFHARQGAAPLVSVVPPGDGGGVWSLHDDAELVRYMVALAETHQCDALALSEGMVLCSPPLPDRHPALAARGIDALLQRVHLLRYLNTQLNAVGYWLDLSPGDASRFTHADATDNVPQPTPLDQSSNTAATANATNATAIDVFGGDSRNILVFFFFFIIIIILCRKN